MDQSPENRAFLRRITRSASDQSFVQALRVAYPFLVDEADAEEAFAAEVAAAVAAAVPDVDRRHAVVQRFRRIVRLHPDAQFVQSLRERYPSLAEDAATEEAAAEEAAADVAALPPIDASRLRGVYRRAVNPSFAQALREKYPSLAGEVAAEDAAAEEAAVARVNDELLELHATSIRAAARPDESTSSRGPAAAASPDEATSAVIAAAYLSYNERGEVQGTPGFQCFPYRLRRGVLSPEHVRVRAIELAADAVEPATARPDAAPSSRGPTADTAPAQAVDAPESAAAVLPDNAPSSHVDAAVRAVDPAFDAASDAAVRASESDDYSSAQIYTHEDAANEHRHVNRATHSRPHWTAHGDGPSCSDINSERVYAFDAYVQARTRRQITRAAWNYIHVRIAFHNLGVPTEIFFDSWRYEEVTASLQGRYSVAQRRTFGAPPTEHEFGEEAAIYIPHNRIGPPVGHALHDDNPWAL